jgi:Family of unknown function (DUF6069)
MSHSVTRQSAPARTGSPGPDLTAAMAWRTGSWAAGLGCAADLLLLGIGVLAGADMNVQPPGSTSALAIGPELVVVTAIVPLVPATLLLAAVRRRGPKGWRLLATTGLAVGVVSAAGPLLSTATPGTKAVLVSMHVVTGLIWFVLVRRAARIRPQMVSSDVN